MRGHFFKAYLLRLQFVTIKKSFLNYQAPAANLLFCYIASPSYRRMFKAKRFITLRCCDGASCPAGTGQSLGRDVAGGTALPGPAASAAPGSTGTAVSSRQLRTASPLGTGLVESEHVRWHHCKQNQLKFKALDNP